MNVKLIASTDVDNVLEYVGSIAGICYGKDDPSAKRAIRCAENGHASIFEHMSFTFDVDGISRACSHQLVRHRLASFTQQSQRYCVVDSSDDNWYVVPESLCHDHIPWYKNQMGELSKYYDHWIKLGIKQEDARYLLPNATKTRIIITMNLRELCHFKKLRSSKHSQWEIRHLANNMWDQVVKRYPELNNFEIKE